MLATAVIGGVASALLVFGQAIGHGSRATSNRRDGVHRRLDGGALVLIIVLVTLLFSVYYFFGRIVRRLAGSGSAQGGGRLGNFPARLGRLLRVRV